MTFTMALGSMGLPCTLAVSSIRTFSIAFALSFAFAVLFHLRILLPAVFRHMSVLQAMPAQSVLASFAFSAFSAFSFTFAFAFHDKRHDGLQLLRQLSMISLGLTVSAHMVDATCVRWGLWNDPLVPLITPLLSAIRRLQELLGQSVQVHTRWTIGLLVPPK